MSKNSKKHRDQLVRDVTENVVILTSACLERRKIVEMVLVIHIVTYLALHFACTVNYG